MNLKTANTLNSFPYQFIIKILIPSTHNDLVYLKKIRNYKQTFYVITKSNDKMKAETTLESLDFIHKITDMKLGYRLYIYVGYYSEFLSSNKNIEKRVNINI